jgi:DNA-directed RNA polymerase specialized sigma subunit
MKGIKRSIKREEARRRKAFLLAENAPNSGNKQERYWIEFEKLDALYRASIGELYALQAEIQRVIDMIPDSTQREIIKCRYIEERTLEQTANFMNFSYAQVCRIQERAYLAVEKIINL